MGAARPGRPVRGSKTGRPIMAAFDLLGQRWTLRLVWELRGGALTFRALQAACDHVSPSTLNQRLLVLGRAGLIERGDGGYVLSELGRELIQALAPLDAWSRRWERALPGPPGRDGS